MNVAALLQLHVEWGADEALLPLPRDRLTPPPAAPAPVAIMPPPIGAAARADALAAGCHNLADLRAALASFTECSLQSTAIHLVFADGNPDASLMLIGDAPGEAEDRTGRPFSGPGGDLLDRMLASIGLDRTAALLTHAIPWRPPGNRKPSPHERRLCLPFLHRHIALVRPRRLLLLGQLAATSLIAQDATLRRLRGSWHPASVPGLDTPIQALATYAPDHLLATPTAKREAWADLLTLRAALDGSK